MNANGAQKPILSNETCLLISGIVEFLNGKDKILTDKSQSKGEDNED